MMDSRDHEVLTFAQMSFFREMSALIVAGVMKMLILDTTRNMAVRSSHICPTYGRLPAQPSDVWRNPATIKATLTTTSLLV